MESTATAKRATTSDKELFEKRLIQEYFSHKRHGVVVEVGANEPLSETSQSWHLERDLSWRAILIEPNPALSKRARDLRPTALTFECACVSENTNLSLFVPISSDGQEMDAHAAIGRNLDSHNYRNFREIPIQGRSLNSVLEEARVESIDLLSIDVEGAELEVLKGFDIERYRPALILFEDKHYHLRKHRWFVRRGYVLCKRTNLNCWYVPRGGKRPPLSMGERVRLLKRLYVSIWWRKLQLLFRTTTSKPAS